MSPRPWNVFDTAKRLIVSDLKRARANPRNKRIGGSVERVAALCQNLPTRIFAATVS